MKRILSPQYHAGYLRILVLIYMILEWLRIVISWFGVHVDELFHDTNFGIKAAQLLMQVCSFTTHVVMHSV